MPAGEPFSPRQREEIVRAMRLAHQECGLLFSVYVGGTGEDTRAYAERLHSAVENPADTVLVAADPDRHRLEIVTGTTAHRALDDRSCALAAMTMTSAFAAGDLVGGITGGLVTLAGHARQPRTLHTDQLG
ncbi:MAG: DUF5130 family protein [Actinomycetes bacterium]